MGQRIRGMKQTDVPIQKHENDMQNNVDFIVSNFPGKLVQKFVCDEDPDCPFWSILYIYQNTENGTQYIVNFTACKFNKMSTKIGGWRPK